MIKNISDFNLFLLYVSLVICYFLTYFDFSAKRLTCIVTKKTEVETIFVWTTNFYLCAHIVFYSYKHFFRITNKFFRIYEPLKNSVWSNYIISMFLFLKLFIFVRSLKEWLAHFFKSHRLSLVYSIILWVHCADAGGYGSAPPPPYSRWYTPACKCLCKLVISNHHYVF